MPEKKNAADHYLEMYRLPDLSNYSKVGSYGHLTGTK